MLDRDDRIARREAGVAVGDDQRRRTRIERAKAVEHVRLARGVERGRGFVEDEQGRAPKQRPGQYQPLAFASRQLTPAVADAGRRVT